MSEGKWMHRILAAGALFLHPGEHIQNRPNKALIVVKDNDQPKETADTPQLVPVVPVDKVNKKQTTTATKDQGRETSPGVEADPLFPETREDTIKVIEGEMPEELKALRRMIERDHPELKTSPGRSFLPEKVVADEKGNILSYEVVLYINSNDLRRPFGGFAVTFRGGFYYLKVDEGADLEIQATTENIPQKLIEAIELRKTLDKE